MSKYISVIIPTCHRNDLLEKCLERLESDFQILSPVYFEVIVTDDGSKSTAQELLQTRFSSFSWVKGPGKGPAANRNNGAKYAKGEWLVFLDDDCLPSHDWLETYHLAIQKNPEVRVWEGAIHCDNEQELENEFAECPVNKTGNNFWSANIAVKKDLFVEVGGFDEGYFLAAQEDQQLKIDLEKRAPIVFLPDCIVVHPVRYITLEKAIQRIPKQTKNFGRFAAKNRVALHYSSFGFFYKEQILFHIAHLARHVKARRIKQSLVSVAWLFFGIHLGGYYFKKFSKERL